MRCTAAFIISLLLSGRVFAQVPDNPNLDKQGIPAIPQRIIDNTLQYQNIRSAVFNDWLPGGKGILIGTRFAEANQIHQVAIPGGARTQLTFLAEPARGALSDPRPDKSGFLFSMDKGGAEFFQLYYFDIASGSTTQLTDGKSRNTGARWTKSGSRVYFSSNLRNGKDTDVRVLDPQSPSFSQPVTEAEGTWNVWDVSPDEKTLVVQKEVSAEEARLYTLDVASRKLTEINSRNDLKVAYGGAAFSRDRKSLYFVTDDAGEFKSLWQWDLSTSTKNNLTSDLKWDVSGFVLSHDGKMLAFVDNEDGLSRLYLMNASTHHYQVEESIPPGVIQGFQFSPDDAQLALTITAPQVPSDVFVLDVKDRVLTRWTYSELGGLNAGSFVSPKIIRYQTFDSVKEIPALYFKPVGASMVKKAPVIISIHGGPEGQERPQFNANYQYYLKELGCAVIAPNVRGSTGYGKTYLSLDNGFKRMDAVKDIGALLDWIARQPELDARRIAVTGGSYGGFMTLASMVEYSGRLTCGIDVVGISDFTTFLERTEAYRRDLRRVEYGDERIPEMRAFFKKIAPVNNASRISKPLFVVQGKNDPRVPWQEAEQIVKAVQANNVPVWYLMAKNEGHGFQKKSNTDYLSWSRALFFEEYLLK